jgi:hypothetical protein
MEVELETLAEEEEEEDTIELGEVQELGTEILEMILEQVFEVKTWSPRAHRGAQWPNYHRLPRNMWTLIEEHARRAEQKGSLVNIYKERHMCPQWRRNQTWKYWEHSSSTGHEVQCFVLSMGHGGPYLHKNRGWLLL